MSQSLIRMKGLDMGGSGGWVAVTMVSERMMDYMVLLVGETTYFKHRKFLNFIN